MPKQFSDEQRLMVRDLAAQGKNNTEIAALMSERFPADWNAKSAHRTVARILKEDEMPEEPRNASSVPKTLDEMTREERTRFIEARVQSTPRFRMAFRNFEPEEKDVFVHEYMNVIRSTETLTEVEEQALFSSILELILAFQALNRKETEEKWRDMSLRGELTESDPRYRRIVDNKYHKEYDEHMKLYQKGMGE